MKEIKRSEQVGAHIWTLKYNITRCAECRPDNIGGKQQDQIKPALMTRTVDFLSSDCQKENSFHSIDAQEKQLQHQISLPSPNWTIHPHVC